MKKNNKTKSIGAKSDVLGPGSQAPEQCSLFLVETQCEIDGIEMGVLENGVPYLSESGLARMCGIDRRVLNRLATNWQDEKKKPRGIKINDLLLQSGYTEDSLYLVSRLNNQDVNAYTEPVCLALLEYYAFLSEGPRQEAVRAFRTLARKTFRDFVYSATGYSPEQRLIDSWKHFHDRVDMTSTRVPDGYYSIFNEIAVMIVPMIRSGVIINDKVIPDISVGKIWSKYWTDNNLDSRYGERIKYQHSYPDYYPQAKSNPQPSFAYPESSLGVFRHWLRETYIYSKFPKYLVTKIKDLSISSKTAQMAISAFSMNSTNALTN